jgi:hypothetical protein
MILSGKAKWRYVFVYVERQICLLEVSELKPTSSEKRTLELDVNHSQDKFSI